MTEARLFYTDEALAYGVDEAILVNYLRLFITGNRAKEENTGEDGRTYTYNTYKEITDVHPYWSKQKVGRMVRSLVRQGVLIVDYLSDKPFDRTSYFAFVDEDSMLSRKKDQKVHQQSIRRFTDEASDDSQVNSLILKSPKESLKKPKEGEKTRKPRFSAPSIDDVKAYAKEKGKPDHAEAFVLFYESKNWYVGKSKMVRWKASYALWCKRQEDKQTPPWAKPEVTANRVRSCVVCGAPATHSYQGQSYCEDHDQYTKKTG
jgi:hypothetical protein